MQAATITHQGCRRRSSRSTNADEKNSEKRSSRTEIRKKSISDQLRLFGIISLILSHVKEMLENAAVDSSQILSGRKAQPKQEEKIHHQPTAAKSSDAPMFPQCTNDSFNLVKVRKCCSIKNKAAIHRQLWLEMRQYS